MSVDSTAASVVGWALAGLLLVLSAATRAAPEDGDVVVGTGFVTVDDSVTEILQVSNRLAIEWESFDIEADETVRFLQPSVDAIALNRIVGGDVTRIFGRLEANGQVALINSRGIIFADSATVDVGALIASGLDFDPEDVAADDWQLMAATDDAGFVINRGLIEAATGATLIGRRVANEAGALIAADVVQLVGADAAVLTFDDAALIGVTVNTAVAANPDGAAAAVQNLGQLTGSRVLLEASVAEALFANAVNNTGVVRAQGIDTSGGVIRLVGSGADVVVNGGDLEADGITGGEIRIDGERVALRGATTLAATGPDGGGEISVVGAEAIYVGSNVLLAVNGTAAGDGGEVAIESGGTTRFFGDVEARGGISGGDGGRVEVIGTDVLVANGRVDTRATLGSAGDYLLESADIAVAGGSGGVDDGNPFPSEVTESLVHAAGLGASLATGNVTLTAGGATAGAITVAADVDLDGSNGNTLTLVADDVVLDAGVEVSDAAAGSPDASRIVVRAEGGITLDTGSRLASSGGDISLESIAVDNLGIVDAGTGAIRIETGRGGSDSDSTLGTLISSTAIEVAGGAGDDVFQLTGAVGTATMNLNGGGGSNRVVTSSPDQTFTLGLGAAQFSLPGIAFSSIQRLDAAGSSNVLLGNGVDRVFAAPAPGRVSVNGVLFDGFGEVVGSGNDTLTSTGAFALTGIDREISHRGVLFRGLDSVVAGAGTLTGTTGDDTFAATADAGEILVRGIDFTGLAVVSGGGGVDHLDASTGAVALTGVDREVGHQGMLFRELSSVTAGDGTMIGSAGGDLFTASAGAGEVQVGAVDFTGLDLVIGGGGDDRLNATAGEFTLTGVADEVSHRNIVFRDVGNIGTGGGTLTGTAADEVFTTAGSAGEAQVNAIRFEGLDLVIGGGGSDRLTATGGTFALTGIDGELNHQDILFRGLADVAAGGGTLAGTAGDDAFLADGGEVNAAAIAFTELDLVAGGGGRDLLLTPNAGDLISLEGTGAVTHDGVTFHELTSVDTVDGILQGSAAPDSFSIGAAGTLLAAGLELSGLAEVRGSGAGSGDLLVGSAGDDQFNLTGADGFDYRGILFRSLERVAAGGGANTLAGTSGGDTFQIEGTGAVSAAGARFDGIGVVAAAGGIDRVIGSSTDDVFEAPAPNRVDASGMSFLQVERVDAGASIGDLLLGTPGDDQFALTGSSRSLSFAGIVFENLDRVDGAGGSNSVLGTAADDQVSASGSRTVSTMDVSFAGIDTVIGNGGDDRLVAGADDDVFTLGAAAGELRYRDVRFEQWHRIDGGGGHDTVTGRVAADAWQLTDEQRVEVHGLDFANVDAASGNGGADRVLAMVGGSHFLLDGSERVTSGGITFDGMLGGIAGGAGDDTFQLTPGFSGSYVVDGGAGNNRLIGHDQDDTFILTGTSGRLRYRAAELRGIDLIDGGAGVNALQGSGGDDAVALTAAGALAVDGMVFTALHRVDLGAGVDRISGAAGGTDFRVTGTNAVQVAGIRFDEVERLQGGAGNDHFDFDPGAALSAGVGGGTGHDLLSAHGDALDWHVTGSGNRVGTTPFEGIETLADFSSTQTSLTSDFELTFNEGQWIGFSGGDVARFEYRAIDAMTVSGGAMHIDALPFDGGMLTLNSTGAVTGSALVVDRLLIDAAGDIVLDLDVAMLGASSGGNIDITQTASIELLDITTAGGTVRVRTDADQTVSSIDAGAGTVTLRSAFGRLLVADAAAGAVQISAGQIELDALLSIGTVENPFFLRSSRAPQISALEYISPLLAPGTPQPIAQGRRIASLAEAIASSGLRSAVQPYAVDLVLIDPAIFTALLPFSLGSEAVALPEE